MKLKIVDRNVDEVGVHELDLQHYAIVCSSPQQPPLILTHNSDTDMIQEYTMGYRWTYTNDSAKSPYNVVHVTIEVAVQFVRRKFPDWEVYAFKY